MSRQNEALILTLEGYEIERGKGKRKGGYMSFHHPMSGNFTFKLTALQQLAEALVYNPNFRQNFYEANVYNPLVQTIGKEYTEGGRPDRTILAVFEGYVIKRAREKGAVFLQHEGVCFTLSINVLMEVYRLLITNTEFASKFA